MLFSKKLKVCCNTESGRSMIEMLGVLAIIGVLSIAGIAGYEFAVLKFRVNEIINELNGRAISVSSLLLNDKHTYVPEEVIEDGFGDTLSIGYGVESAISDRNSNYFEISVMNVPSDVCVQLLKSYENPIMIFADDVSYNNDTSICHSESGVVDMDFIYRNDLGEHDKCSSKGYFGVDDFQCHCSGNTYIDPDNPRECLCPGGHVWSEVENTCIESICPEGYFESLSNGCVPCSDETMYTIKGTTQVNLCKACGNRNVGSFNQTVYCYNMEKPTCTPGSQVLGAAGTCINCDVSNYFIYIFTTQDAKDLCNQCPNRHASGGICKKSTGCTLGTHFYSIDNGCDPCYTTAKVQIGSHQNEIDACLACRNNSGVANRGLIGEGDYTYCIKTLCDSGEFMGADGQCYKCTHNTKIAVNSNSGCTDTACNRVEVTAADGVTYCQLSSCPTDGTYALVDGNCYPCGGRNGDWSAFSATKAQCDQCSNPARLWVGTYVDESTIGRCMWNCTYGEQIPLGAGQNLCYSCAGGGGTAGDGSTLSCGSEVCRHYCEGCNGHVVGSTCYINTSCDTGTEFRVPNDTYTFCTGCDQANKAWIGTHPLERQKCLDCSSVKRFWVGSYCYRCDTIETPDVITDEERDSCLSCTNMRTVNSENKCVLIQ